MFSAIQNLAWCHYLDLPSSLLQSIDIEIQLQTTKVKWPFIFFKDKIILHAVNINLNINHCKS